MLMQLIADPLWTITAIKKKENVIVAGQIYYLYREIHFDSSSNIYLDLDIAFLNISLTIIL